MYKIIATDLDGTLLKADQTISEETKKVLAQLDERGVIFLPSTGRTAYELPPVLQNLPFLKYVCYCNGAGIYDVINQKSIVEINVDNATLLKTLQYADEHDIYPTVVVDNVRFVNATEEGTIDFEIMKHAPKAIIENTTPVNNLYKMFEENGKDCQKLLFYIDESADKDGIMADLKETFPGLCISSSGRFNIELNHKNANKGDSLLQLCEFLGLDIKDTIGFGDSDNDIDLLKTAGLSVVTANGNDNAKQYADEICDSCDNDGVRKTLEKYFY